MGAQCALIAKRKVIMDYINFKIHITDKGFSGSTGYVGPYEFENGVSVEKLHRNEAEQFSASIACEALDEDGSVAFPIYPGEVPASEDDLVFKSEPTITAQETEEVQKETVEETQEPDQTLKPIATKEDLELIADKAGLVGLREYANQYNIKGKSIPELIKRILAAQE